MWRVCGDARAPFPPVPGGRILLPRAAPRPTRDGAAGHPENRIPCPRDRTTKDRLAMLECRARARRRVDSSEVRDQRGLGVGPGHPSHRRHDAAAMRRSERRVRSWLRMNAGGAPNTCKSNGRTHLGGRGSGERLSNTWATCPPPRDSLGKPWVIPDVPPPPHGRGGKAPAGGDGPAAC